MFLLIGGRVAFYTASKKMNEGIQGAGSGRIRVASLAQLDALVGERVAGDTPEVAWQDSYGMFRFSTRGEAEEAIQNSYYRLFWPDLDWDSATVQEVRQYPPYTTDLGAAWTIVERLGEQGGRTEIRRQGDSWRAAFAGAEAFAATPAMAICLAALRSRGIDPIFCEALLDEETASSIDSEEESETVDIL